MSNLVCIQTFSNRMEAGLATSVLEANGIKASVSADDAGGMRPELGFTTGGVKLFVLDNDAAAAVRILEDNAGTNSAP